jgi:PIN domain nuclease of toxin-antitoxin system
MRYLIDTNVFINIVEEGFLSKEVRTILDNCENIIYVSSESIKEFVHLVQGEKIVPKKHIRSLDVFDFIENILGLKVKYVAKEHLRTFVKLDLVEGHNDPRDRLIISQALTEKIPLISSDTKFPNEDKRFLRDIMHIMK